MFLPEEQWSPRYEKQFYTIRMSKYKIVHSTYEIMADAENLFRDDDDDDSCSSIFGFCNPKKKYPAVYYEIEVRSGTKRHTCLRRYSQFHHLCKTLDPRGEMDGLMKSLPPKTAPFFHNDTDDDFIEERMAGLYSFMRGVLLRQECLNNPLVQQFLRLNDE